MNRAEMEEHWRQYMSLITDARRAEKHRLFTQVVALCRESWDHLDGMLRCERSRNETTTNRLDGVLLVLKYAPPLLDFESLDVLEQLLRAKRRIANASEANLNNALESARYAMRCAHGIWNHLERHRECSLDTLNRSFPDDSDTWRKIVAAWESMHVICRSTTTDAASIRFGSWADETIEAKCPHCGSRCTLPRASRFDESPCPHCTRDSTLCLLDSSS